MKPFALALLDSLTVVMEVAVGVLLGISAWYAVCVTMIS